MEEATPPRLTTLYIDLANECAWRGQAPIKLTPKAFALLRHLTHHPGRVATKAELLAAVWPSVVVSDGVLTTCVQELRHALGDEARAPRYIETVHRRGYRFIAPLAAAPPVQGSTFKVQGSQSATRNPQSAINLVGREAELQQLRKWLEKALADERQIVFVRGEAGIGKTTVVEAFLEQAATIGNLWIGRGQCIEHFGTGEPYLPVLEALGRLCREPAGEPLVVLLGQHAPTWLAQMPALLNPVELEALQRKILGATQERMLRELAEAVEALTAERGLVVWLEDLQWSDYSTLELVGSLARRREPARLLVIGTYRPLEMLRNEHPLRAVTQELRMHRQCKELRLECLTEAHVAEYLAARFAAPSPVSAEEGWGEDLSHAPLQRLAHTIHRRTEGNPLFMVNVVDDLIAQGTITQVDDRWELKADGAVGKLEVPEDIRHMIERQFDRLSPEAQRVLETASVAGVEFSAAVVAAGIGANVGTVEERCAELARRGQFLWASGIAEWPDGTVAAQYRFLHALYQEVLYERVSAGRRIELHQRIGEREEKAHGARAREVAAELAMHFEQGRDYRRAVQYLQYAGENAQRRSAHREAINHLSKGLELLKILPESPERIQQELMLQVTFGPPLIVIQGYGAPEVETAYARARELCRQAGETPELFFVLRGLENFYVARAEFQTARELGEQLLALAQRQCNPTLLVGAHMALGPIAFFVGEFASAREHCAKGMNCYDPKQDQSLIWAGGHPAVQCLLYESLALWQLGYPSQALEKGREALVLAHRLPHPFSLALTLCHVAILHQFRREGHAAQEQAEAAIARSAEQGFRYWLATGRILQGWSLVEQGRREEVIVQLRQGLTAVQATGVEVVRPLYLALLAEAYGKVGRVKAGLNVLAEALAVVNRTGERWYEAELYRLYGELTLQQFNVQGSKFKVTNPQPPTPNPYSEAEACFRKAIEIARKQQAKSLELRATMSLARLWQQQGKKKQAHRMLSKIYHWFTEGFDTVDLQEAKAFLAELT